jgi:hypothetical protein
MFWLLSLALVAAAPPSKTYLGHQVVWGTVSVPLRGDLDIRTDTWMVVEMQTSDDGSVQWTQRDCNIAMSPMMGIKTAFAEGAVARLPKTVARFTPGPLGTLTGRWKSTWTQADHDQDGFPGVSVHVDMPLCGGSVYITMTSHTDATATWVGQELLGEIKMTMERRTLGASNWCLRLGPNREEKTMVGVFLLQPVVGVSACEAVAADAWPNALRDIGS